MKPLFSFDRWMGAYDVNEIVQEQIWCMKLNFRCSTILEYSNALSCICDPIIFELQLVYLEFVFSSSTFA